MRPACASAEAAAGGSQNAAATLVEVQSNEDCKPAQNIPQALMGKFCREHTKLKM